MCVARFLFVHHYLRKIFAQTESAQQAKRARLCNNTTLSRQAEARHYGNALFYHNLRYFRKVNLTSKATHRKRAIAWNDHFFAAFLPTIRMREKSTMQERLPKSPRVNKWRTTAALGAATTS